MLKNKAKIPFLHDFMAIAFVFYIKKINVVWVYNPPTATIVAVFYVCKNLSSSLKDKKINALQRCRWAESPPYKPI